MTFQLRGRLLVRLVRGWFSACRHAFQSLSDYDELSPELLEVLDSSPQRFELEAKLQQLLYFDVETFRSHIERLFPSEYVSIQLRYPSRSDAALPRLIPWSR